MGDTGSAFSCASPLSSSGSDRAEYSAKEKFSSGYGVLAAKGYVHVGMPSDFVFFSRGTLDGRSEDVCVEVKI